MAMPLSLLRNIQAASPTDAWTVLVNHAWTVCASPLRADKAHSEVAKRDTALGSVDLFLATAGWDLWRSFRTTVPRTADALASWWTDHPPGRAVLVLDALSLREVPWLLEGAAKRGYTVHQSRATAAELPADTTSFAKALGFPNRSALQQRASMSSRLPGATTDTTNLPWEDVATQIHAAKDWLVWHNWPDERLHELGAPGHGLAALTREAADKLQSDDFWALVHRLMTGRRLIITSDHGYAASGLFPDTSEPLQAQYLKDRFKSGRYVNAANSMEASGAAWLPPLDIQLETATGQVDFVLGRRKWKSQGGYPTLTHGGLSLLEVLVPFIELSRAGGV